MFLQLEHNVPDIYVEKSRDFQLICRVINIIINAMAEKSSNILNNLDLSSIDEELLYPLVRKMGFTTHKYFPTSILRNIAENFTYLIRNKGTLEAIKDAVYTIISANETIDILKISYNNVDKTIDIISDATGDYLEYITELLEFLVPIGITWNYVQNVTQIEYQDTPITYTDSIERFRGIGDVISHIIQSNGNIIMDNNGSDLTARGVDWDKLNDYKTGWNGNSEEPGKSKPNTFYSKINIAKIIVKQPSNSEIDIDSLPEKG